MMKNDRDTIDDLFRSKLYDLEEDTMPEDWAAIESRLITPTIPFYRKSWFQWAAAVAVLLIISFGITWNLPEDDLHRMAQEVSEDISPLRESDADQVQKNLIVGVTESKEDEKEDKKANQILTTVPAKKTLIKTKNYHDQSSSDGVRVEQKTNVADEDIDEEEGEQSSLAKANQEDSSEAVNAKQSKDSEVSEKSSNVFRKTSDAFQKTSDISKERKPSKWRFGMGAGSLSAGNSSSVNAFALRSSAVSNEYLTLMNSTSLNQLPKTDVKHREPVSLGFSVSRMLTDRWALQTGLSYSYLLSEWSTNKSYHAESKQQLHFLGVPVSVTYKIAEWKKIMFYVSAGGKVELNVAGKVKTDLYSPVEKLKSVTERERMKEPYFSVDGRIGLSYPLFRFFSAYAEVGTDYYFKNGSDIETIHSEKPFKVGFQFGFRLGF